MGLETHGRIHAIFDAQQVTERFRKREFVLELSDNPRYPQYVQFQLTGDRCEGLDGFQVGDEVRVEFSLRGREWTSPRGETKFFNSLDVWKLERTGDAVGASPAGLDEPPPSGRRGHSLLGRRSRHRSSAPPQDEPARSGHGVLTASTPSRITRASAGSVRDAVGLHGDTEPVRTSGRDPPSRREQRSRPSRSHAPPRALLPPPG